MNNHSEYDFTLILTGIVDFTESDVDKLFDAGCDDCTVAQRSGRVFLTFSRESESLVSAAVSAIEDVRTANIGAEVLRVDSCNLITQAEIARRLGRTRQNIEQFISGKRGHGFPPPACNLTEGQPLYYWCEVAHWAYVNKIVSEQVHKESQELAVLNNILELHQLKINAPTVTNELLEALRLCPPCVPN